jgi:hypothetical protein
LIYQSTFRRLDQRITLTGRRLGRRRPHTCSASLRLPPGRRRRIVRTVLVLPRTGCFRVVASGAGLWAVVPVAVPGPDWCASPS